MNRWWAGKFVQHSKTSVVSKEFILSDPSKLSQHFLCVPKLTSVEVGFDEGTVIDELRKCVAMPSMQPKTKIQTLLWIQSWERSLYGKSHGLLSKDNLLKDPGADECHGFSIQSEGIGPIGHSGLRERNNLCQPFCYLIE